MIGPAECEKPGCAEVPIVGLGRPPVWLCVRHLAEALQAISERIRAAVAASQNGGQRHE